ncbi:hypothetical protein [Nafulsella turpanensis]|uniref:hypothetical protein n=1 Tax=Nafulsella turpanensis TaxID=1265690 RepID=UPI00034932F9|nr:hypothetical protein [Nafulsella turpanensis]
MKVKAKPKQILNCLQNDLLLLFLKYNLAFRSNIKELEELPMEEDDFRKVLSHCLFHAVFGKASEGDPFLSLQIKKASSLIQLELTSSGNASSFEGEINSYCQDQLFAQSLSSACFSTEITSLVSMEVEECPLNGSKINSWFKPS